jgi:hypothetical protein
MNHGRGEVGVEEGEKGFLPGALQVSFEGLQVVLYHRDLLLAAYSLAARMCLQI